MRTHLDELPFGHVAPPNVLEHEDVSRLIEIRRGTKLRAVQIDSVGAHTIWRAVDQKRVRTRTVLGYVDGGEQANAVAHRDSVLVLRVVLFDVIVRWRIGTVLRPKTGGQAQSK